MDLHLVEDLKHIQKGVDLMARTEAQENRDVLHLVITWNLDLLCSRYSRKVDKRRGRGPGKKGKTV